jgi:thioesterase domain-containing protein
VVVAREESGGSKLLVAYFVRESGGAQEGPTSGELRAHLAERLPEYMVPSAFVMLEEIPSMPNGKVDRRALPAPGRDRAGGVALVAPRDALELKLTQIWEELLGVRPVGVTDNFFELGGHSLLAVRLISSIREQLGVALPLPSLFQATTVERLACLLRGRSTGEGHPPLVAIKPTGSKRPFFCVHPAGGNVFCYVELANHLDAEQPFYAFQAPGFEGGSRYMRVEELAGLYVGSLREFQPEGPYMLGGWSRGGVLAFEMARQLEAQGQRVDLLALLDSVVPAPDARTRKADEVSLMLSLGAHMGLSLGHLTAPDGLPSGLTFDERLAALLDRAKADGLVPSDIGLEQVRGLYELFRNNVRALGEYVPGRYAGGVTVIRADDRPAAGGHEADPTEGWGGLAGGGVEIYRVPGNHFSIVRRPHVGALAGQLEICIRRSTGA